jgi:hypothetical protein
MQVDAMVYGQAATGLKPSAWLTKPYGLEMCRAKFPHHTRGVQPISLMPMTVLY